jgi:hypothetical protein
MTATTTSHEDLVRSAYARRGGQDGSLVRVKAIRQELESAGLTDREIAEALEGMYRSHAVNLVPGENPNALTQGDHDAALWVGGEHKHYLSIR